MNILILGGTADARHLTERLVTLGYNVLYSIAGLVRIPNLQCEVVVGGFSQFGGLEAFLKERKIGLVINATHPYAATMSNTAVQAGAHVQIPVWRFLRPAWRPQAQDNWFKYDDDNDLLTLLNGFKRPLLSAGQMSEPIIQNILALPSIEHVLWRTAASPKFDVPDTLVWQKAIGPFSLASEQALLEQHHIDVIVSKNSGGTSTSAKLDAARKLGISVLMQRRPRTLDAIQTYGDLDTLITAIQHHIAQTTPTAKDSDQQ